MKQERNNEIDLLLRRMSRRNGSTARDTEAGEQHLDADELSAYAENALPPAARARYIEHLAECATCRKLATELSLSSGATAAPEIEIVAQPGWFKQFLASLFSPLVLRYAVPALGLIVVAAVGFVMLRQRSEHTFMARVNTEPTTPVPVTKPEAPASGLTSQDGSLSEPQEKHAAGETPTVKPAEPKRDRQTAATDAASSSAQPVATADRAVSELQPGVAAGGVAPATAPKATPAETEADKKAEEAAKKAPAPAAQTVEIRKEPEKDSSPTNYQSAKENENTAQDKMRAVPLASSNNIAGLRAQAAKRRAPETKRADDENGKAKDSPSDDAETRSIAGRRFRKERGIWVDTAYDSSTATVNMARGSEQFRALMADEPVIGTIAKQLDGEVIVVWKGHAYRIR